MKYIIKVLGDNAKFYPNYLTNCVASDFKFHLNNGIEKLIEEKGKSDSWCFDIFNDFSSDEIGSMPPSIIGAWKRGELLTKLQSEG